MDAQERTASRTLFSTQAFVTGSLPAIQNLLTLAIRCMLMGSKCRIGPINQLHFDSYTKSNKLLQHSQLREVLTGSYPERWYCWISPNYDCKRVNCVPKGYRSRQYWRTVTLGRNISLGCLPYGDICQFSI